jgi:cysteine synthase A
VSESRLALPCMRLSRSTGMIGLCTGYAHFVHAQIGSRPEYAGKLIVVVIPSFGERYLSTDLFKQEWEAVRDMPVSPVPG